MSNRRSAFMISWVLDVHKKLRKGEGSCTKLKLFEHVNSSFSKRSRLWRVGSTNGTPALMPRARGKCVMDNAKDAVREAGLFTTVISLDACDAAAVTTERQDGSGPAKDSETELQDTAAPCLLFPTFFDCE
jgi:hypothetical protein